MELQKNQLAIFIEILDIEIIPLENNFVETELLIDDIVSKCTSLINETAEIEPNRKGIHQKLQQRKLSSIL